MIKNIQQNTWMAPGDWIKIRTIDAHAGGEPLRIVIEGFPQPQGDTMLAKRQFAITNLDNLRKTLMWEPRGHADMYGCIITPAVSPEADLGVLFIHNDGFSSMCGHGIIALTKVLLETKMFPMTTPVTTLRIDTPAGLVTAHAKISENKVTSVSFHNVPSFVLSMNQKIDIPGIGELKYDIAFGGAFYAFVQAEDIGLACTKDNFRQLIEKGMAIKNAVMSKNSIVHPFEKELSFLYGTIFIEKAHSTTVDSRNVCIFANGEVDRSPTGTGVSARMALHYAKGEIGINQPMVIESIIGSRFIANVFKTVNYGPYEAVIPEVEGTAHITGQHEFVIDPDDSIDTGFLLM